MSLGEYGLAPRFREAVSRGLITIRDSTCPAIHAGLQAAEKGVPFIPLRGILGSDVEVHRSDWRVIDNPFEAGDPILLLPAIQPDVALFHAAVADRNGNVWIGVRRELMTMAHAARMTLVTVETITDDDLLADDRTAAGTIPALYVTAVAEAREGAWPIGLRGCYPADGPHLRLYAEAAQTEEGFRHYLDEHVDRPAAVNCRPEELLIAAAADLLEGRGPCGGGCALAHSRRRRAARPRALGRAHARVPARQRRAQLLHRRRAGAVRLCRAGTDRRLLPRWRADRRRGQHQPRRHRRLPAERRSPGRLVRLLLPLLPRTARDPLQARAHEADARRAGRLRQRSRHEPSAAPTVRAGRSRS